MNGFTLKGSKKIQRLANFLAWYRPVDVVTIIILRLCGHLS